MYNIIKIYNKFDILKSIMFTDEVRIIELKHRTKQLMQKKHSKNHLYLFLIFIYFIDVYWIYSVALVSGVQQYAIDINLLILALVQSG